MKSSYVLRNGSVYTMNPAQPWAQSVVVHGRDIAYVGTDIGAQAYIDSMTEVIDLKGGMALPGFIDSHNHLAMGAITKLGVSVAGATGREAVCRKIREWFVEQPDDGSVLRGHGWYPDVFETRSPRREWLDEITGNRPMYLLSADAHDIWFNTAAMTRSGIDANTPDPDPGSQYYKRDADGTPTGHGIEGASTPVLMALGLFSDDTLALGQTLSLDPAPSWGITAYQECGVLVGPTSDDAAHVYQGLMDRDHQGKLPLRIAGTVWTRQETDDVRQITETLKAWNRQYRSEHLQIAVCKLWSDGGLFSGGALLLEPSCSEPHSTGAMTFTAEHIEAQIEAVQLAGFDMHIHTDADGSVRTVLDAYERVQRKHGRQNRRHVIAHNTLVHPDDIGRFFDLGILANCTPLWGTDYNGQLLRIYEELVGLKRMQQRLQPYGDLVRSGAIVTYGSDIPGVDIHEIAPLVQIEALLTRQQPDWPNAKQSIPRQRIGLHDALRGYTVNGAYQLRQENLIGSLEVGKRADIVVLADNLFTADLPSIHKVPVMMTMMDGKITHCDIP